MSSIPILYSFRRCPYAIRARMALFHNRINCRVREVVFRDMPKHLLEISPKGTVPVLWFPDTNKVLEESLDIMLWAQETADSRNSSADPAHEQKQLLHWIERNDGPFKAALDRYKYPSRFPGEKIVPLEQREIAVETLALYETVLQNQKWLQGTSPGFLDFALMPFVRQFAGVENDWFCQDDRLRCVANWLTRAQNLTDFEAIMTKFPAWKPGDPEPLLFAE